MHGQKNIKFEENILTPYVHSKFDLALLLLNIIRQILVWRWLPVKYLETAF
jgi:hypothetical protein